MGLATFGQIDWEQRIDYDVLWSGRLARAKRFLERSDFGAVLCFDAANIRYVIATTIGWWGFDKLACFCLLPRGGEPAVWDFGSAVRDRQLYCSWLDGRSPAGISTLRGVMPIGADWGAVVVDKIHTALAEQDLLDEPLAVDVVEPQVLFALQRSGLNIVDGQELMLQARGVKSREEIQVLTRSCSLVGAVYERPYEVASARGPLPKTRETESHRNRSSLDEDLVLGGDSVVSGG